jgi:hypothetical protein
VAEEVVELVDPLYVAMVEAVPWRSGYGHAVGFAGKGYPLVNVYITMETSTIYSWENQLFRTGHVQ